MARRLMLKTLLADAERAGIRVDADGRGRFEIGRRERGIVVNAAGYMCRWADADQVLPPRCGLADAYAHLGLNTETGTPIPDAAG